MVSWYTDEITILFRYRLGFQVSFGVLLAGFAVLYALSIRRHGLLSAGLEPYQRLSNATSALIMVLTFVSIGPWALCGAFYVLFLFQVLQLFVHGLLSFTVVSRAGGRARVLCVPVRFAPGGAGRLAARGAAAAGHALLALWLHYSLDLACWLIDKDAFVRMKNGGPRAFADCVDVVFGANALQTAFHLAAAAEELAAGLAALCAARGRAGAARAAKHATYEDADGARHECSYECSEEAF